MSETVAETPSVAEPPSGGTSWGLIIGIIIIILVIIAVVLVLIFVVFKNNDETDKCKSNSDCRNNGENTICGATLTCIKPEDVICSNTKLCPSGQQCVNNKCVLVNGSSCEVDFQCGGISKCTNNVCEAPIIAPKSVSEGGVCNNTVDCMDDLTCSNNVCEKPRTIDGTNLADANISSGNYRIINNNSRSFLASADISGNILAKTSKTASTPWEVIPISSGNYTIKQITTGLYLQSISPNEEATLSMVPSEVKILRDESQLITIVDVSDRFLYATENNTGDVFWGTMAEASNREYWTFVEDT